MIRKYLSVLLFTCICASLNAQILSVSYQANDKSLVQIFKDLEKTYDLHFAYSTQQLRGKKSSISIQNVSLSKLLEAILKPHQLKHELVNEKFVSVARPESVFLRAQVVDGGSNESLPFATMRLKGTFKGSVSDVDGNFDVIIDEPIDAILEFSFLGYENFELPLENYIGEERIEIALQPTVKNLRQFTVKEYINNGITTDDRASKITINPQEMEILPGLAERDILLSTQILAGINSNDESAGGMNVRGSSRDNTFIYWNNIPIYQSAHYFGNISSFIPSSIGQVDIYKNHIPVQYGGASSAMILVESQKSLLVKPEFESNINFTHGDLYARMPFKKDQGSFMFAARRSYNDLFSTPTFNALSNKLFEGSLTQDVQTSIDENFKFNSKLTFSDFNMQWIYEPNGQNRFSVSALRSGSVLDYNAIDEQEEIESTQTHEVSNFGINAQWDRRWGERLQTNLSVSFSSYDMDYALSEFRELGDDSDNDQESRTNFLRNLEIRLSNDYLISEDAVFQFGYQYNLLNASLIINENNFFEEDFSENIDTRGSIHSLFGDYTTKFSNDWQLSLGARVNNYESTGQLLFDPQMRISYDLNKHWLLKSTMGIYRQHLSAIQESEFTFSNSIEQNWIVADEEETVPLITNYQTVVGFIFNKNGWLVDFDFYAKGVDGLIARNFGPSFTEEDDFAIGSELVLGVDMTLKRKWKSYRVWLSYGFQDSQAELPELGLDNFVSGLNIRHQFQLSQTINLGQFEFSLGYQWKSGLPYTNVTGLTLINTPEPGDDPNDFEPYYEINYSGINTQRLPNYHRVDLSAWYKFPKLTNMKVRGEFGISILNVLNRNNLYKRSFGIGELEDSTIGILRLDKQLLGITPNFSLRLKF